MVDDKAIGKGWVHNPKFKEDAIIEEFDGYASTYDSDMEKWDFRTPKDSLTFLEMFVSKDAKILEAGCGTGLPDMHHYEAGYKNLVGCDLTQKMLDQAATKNIHQKLVCANLNEPLPFEQDEFDCTTCLATLTYLEDCEPALREFCRVTRPGGHILLSQRKDIHEERKTGETFALLEEQGLWKMVHQSEWMTYVANQETYIEQDIKVGYFMFETR